MSGGGSRDIGALEIRPCRAEDYPAVFDLYERAWRGDVERRKTAFRWLHDRNPFRELDASYLLAFKEGVLAGYWGRMPIRFRHRGTPVTFVFTQEALVDPAFRRQGIARRLMEEAVRPENLYLSLWHNEKIVSLLKSHGWSSLGPYHPRKKIHRTDNLLRWKVRNPVLRAALKPAAALVGLLARRRPRPRSSAMAVETASRFGDELDRFFERVAPEFPFLADRGRAVLNWRYADIPHREFTRFVARESGGTVRGYLVAEILDFPEEGLRRGTVVDFLAAPEDAPALDALLDAADRQFREAAVDFAVALQTLPGFHAALKRWGFRKARKPGPIDQLLYLDKRRSPVPDPGGSYRNWVLSYGDSDAYLW